MVDYEQHLFSHKKKIKLLNSSIMFSKLRYPKELVDSTVKRFNQGHQERETAYMIQLYTSNYYSTIMSCSYIRSREGEKRP